MRHHWLGGRVFELKCKYGKELDRCRETLIVDEVEKVSDFERDRVGDAVLQIDPDSVCDDDSEIQGENGLR